MIIDPTPSPYFELSLGVFQTQTKISALRCDVKALQCFQCFCIHRTQHQTRTYFCNPFTEAANTLQVILCDFLRGTLLGLKPSGWHIPLLRFSADQTWLNIQGAVHNTTRELAVLRDLCQGLNGCAVFVECEELSNSSETTFGSKQISPQPCGRTSKLVR